MAPEAEPSLPADGPARLGLPDVSSLTAAAVLASGDSALSAALRRIDDELAAGSTLFAAFANFAPDPH